MSRFPCVRPLAALALTAALAVPALAQPRPAADRPDPAARIARATEGLSLSADQQQQLADLAARHATDAPGTSWALAAEVARVLTPAQVAELQHATAVRRAEHIGREGTRPRAEPARGDRPRGTRGARRARPDAARRPSEAQRDALRGAREATRPQMDALTERFRSGAITPEAFQAERERLDAARRARTDAVLTPEQRQARDAMEAHRDAERTARIQALGLTPQQQSALEALALERVRTAPPRSERTAAPTDADRAARRAAMEQMRTSAEALLTPEQQAIEVVHRALGGDRLHRCGAPGLRAPTGERGVRLRGSRPSGRASER